jgi:hypothetical protein
MEGPVEEDAPHTVDRGTLEVVPDTANPCR